MFSNSFRGGTVNVWNVFVPGIKTVFNTFTTILIIFTLGKVLWVESVTEAVFLVETQ